ncbi:UDP-glucuronosyltransferase 2A2-like isoform X2 [Chiloscyllium plagiosum]|uniref:UDP-glucuronosyltransferase 2A2-like isoform X2 n=1 Tax=Chiloscyllium plagiosum TaxID=36176 RepID=UPI001CB88678|nr:UDP-glucuronosyltransferase 2A2-like isoform X2 [Chiloscyllium plagiosum]
MSLAVNMDCLAWKNRVQFACILTICFTLSCPVTQGANILVVPLDGSHWVNMRILMEELKLRGHNFTVLYFSATLYIKERPDLYQSIITEVEGIIGKNNSEDILDVLIQKTLEALQDGWTPWGFIKFQYATMSFMHACHHWGMDLNTAIFENKGRAGIRSTVTGVFPTSPRYETEQKQHYFTCFLPKIKKNSDGT